MVEIGECGDVADLIVMGHAFAELRNGVVAYLHENGFKYGHNFALANPLYFIKGRSLPLRKKEELDV